MGEPADVTQADFGTVDIDTSKVTIPTVEDVVDITIHRTKTDKKWSEFPVVTTQRTVVINPGLVGETTFDSICEKAAAMFATTEGAEFVSAIRAVIAAKPLKLQTHVVEE